MYTIKETEQFSIWLERLKDIRIKKRILARLRSAQLGNLGDVKRIDRDINEMRIHMGKGYRLYFTIYGKSLVMILSGGTKSSQRKDIARAKQILNKLAPVEVTRENQDF